MNIENVMSRSVKGASSLSKTALAAINKNHQSDWQRLNRFTSVEIVAKRIVTEPSCHRAFV
jgi:hypothetical protein